MSSLPSAPAPSVEQRARREARAATNVLHRHMIRGDARSQVNPAHDVFKVKRSLEHVSAIPASRWLAQWQTMESRGDRRRLEHEVTTGTFLELETQHEAA